MEEPSKLYITDIQSAFLHLIAGRKESEVPFLNKRDKEFRAEVNEYYARTNVPVKKRSLLDPIGFKEIKLKLVIPKKVLINE